MPASASMPPTPQPTMPRPLIIVVCESVPTSVSGIIQERGVSSAFRTRGQAARAPKHALGEVFQIDLMHDADAGRNDLERVERLHAPFEKLVALAVALEFHFQIFNASAEPAKSTCTEWSTTRSTGTSGSMILGFLPSRATAERIAAKSTSSGTPVKSCNTMRATMKGISSVRFRIRFPIGQRAHVLFGDFFAVAIAQDGFEHEPDGNRQLGNRPDSRTFSKRGQ